MRRLMLCAVLLAFATVARAEEPVKLAEADLLRLRLLIAERALIAERLNTVKARADFDHAQKHAEIEAFVRALADREGFDLDLYEPDAGRGVWRKRAAQ